MIEHAENSKYRLIAQSMSENTEGSLFNTKCQTYDVIIIAAPQGYSAIDLEQFDLSSFSKPSSMPSIERHVTHFAYAGEPFWSPNPLSPIFFNLSSDTSMPNSMLTTSSSTKDAPFLSVTRAGSVAHIDDTGCTDPWNDFIRCDTLVEENGYRLL
jgi:hypothetical protein